MVRGFHKNAIDTEIYSARTTLWNAGFIAKNTLCPLDDEMIPFRFKRKQFFVRLSFAMIINKSQGQTIRNVGIYLPEPIFSQGQLYVTLSRATTINNIQGVREEEENEED